MTETTSTVTLPPGPGPAPRALTGATRRRAWGEPGVRIWWLAGLALLVTAGYMATMQAQAWGRGKQLVEHGVAIEAMVKDVDGLSGKGQSGDAAAVATLRFKLNGQDYEVTGKLDDQERAERIVVGSTVPIHVDANDPQVWTGRRQMPPLWRELVGPAIVLPEALAVFLVSLVKRARLLGLWRRGEAVAGVVVQRWQTALAPLSAVARCTPRDPKDQRAFTVFLGKAGGTKVGEVVWVVAEGKRAVAAGVLA